VTPYAGSVAFTNQQTAAGLCKLAFRGGYRKYRLSLHVFLWLYAGLSTNSSTCLPNSVTASFSRLAPHSEKCIGPIPPRSGVPRVLQACRCGGEANLKPCVSQGMLRLRGFQKNQVSPVNGQSRPSVHRIRLGGLERARPARRTPGREINTG
jgi:hypothetical protein